MLDWVWENHAFEAGYLSVCGVDEAGRGPLAGPVVAAAVILPRGIVIVGLNDCKKLKVKKREILYAVICKSAVSYAVGVASAEEIDSINILNAAMLAMQRAVEKLQPPADFALIDGNVSRGFYIPTRTIVGGDALSPSIAAASILAKVTRDRMCIDLDAQYPEYGFLKHKGYPTPAHKRILLERGPTPVHRKTFLKFLEGGKSS